MGGWWISLAEGMYLACAAAEGGVTRKLLEKFSSIKYPGAGLGQKRGRERNLSVLIEVSPGVRRQPIIKHS